MKILALINGLFLFYLGVTGKLASKNAVWSHRRALKGLVIAFIFIIAISILYFTKYFEIVGSIIYWLHPVITILLIIKLYQLNKEKRIII